MADGLFYNDLREPFITVSAAVNTLIATATPIYAASQFPVLGGQYFSRIGKKIKIRLFGVITTALTPGNGSFNVYYGTGAAANGTILMTGTPVALSVSRTADTWDAELIVTCITTGATGTLRCTGHARFAATVIATTLQPIMLPQATAGVSGACDLTAALIISVQYLRSGSTVETMQVIDMEVTALN